jgi:HSP20 family protein
MAEKKRDDTENKKDDELAVTKAQAPRALSPFEEMDRMFESFFPRRWMHPFHWEMSHLPEMTELKMPKVDVIDRDTEIVVKAELPGVTKDDIDLSITDNTVTIKASTSHEEKEENGNYYRCEISRGSFSRTVALPGDVDADSAKASFNDGILELTMPKLEKSHRKSITVE